MAKKSKNKNGSGSGSGHGSGGSGGALHLRGTSGDDILLGGAGNDHINSKGGNDIILGGGGRDHIHGGSGNDSIDGGSGDDKISGGSGDDIILGGTGRDDIKGGSGSDTIDGGSGNDRIDGGSGDDIILGGTGRDDIKGGSGNDTIDGGSGDDKISGGSGDDIILGGTGRDDIKGGSGNDTIDGGAGDDKISGGSGDDIILGGGGNDRIKAGSGNDTVDGGGDNDVITGGTGDDVIDGGAGDDLIIGDGSGASGSGWGRGSHGWGRGSHGSHGSGGLAPSFNDTLDGGSGNDIVIGGVGDDTVLGGTGDDVLFGDFPRRFGSGSGSHGRGRGSRGSGGGSHGRGSGSHGSGGGSRGRGRGSRGSGSGSHGSGSGSDLSFNDYLDGGAGDDQLYAGHGDDLANYTVGENVGASDVYNGGAGIDRLDLNFTLQEWLDLNPDLQDDLDAYLDFLAAHTNPYSGEADGAVFEFNVFDLDASRFEDVGTYVNGVEVDTADDAVTANDDAVLLNEDDPDTAFASVFGNDSAPDFVREIRVITPPAAGILTFNGGTPGYPDGSFNFDPNDDFEWLAEGESTTVSFVYEVEDSDGDTDQATVTITVTGSNDAPTITVADASGTVTEIDDNTAGENIDTLSDSGIIDFADVDLTDTHTVSAALVSATDSENGAVAARGSFTPVINNVSTGDGVGQITWTYQVNDGAVDDLAAGQSLTQVYTVTVTDESVAVTGEVHATATQTVTVTINGNNDVPTVIGAVDSGSVTEIADNAAGENSDTLSDSGTIDFADVDLTDTHTVSATLVSATNSEVIGPVVARGSFTPVINDVSTGDGTGQVTWTYQVNDGAIDDLAVGQSLTQEYTVTVTDENGASVDQTVTITVNGSNDAPVIEGVTGGGGTVRVGVVYQSGGDVSQVVAQLNDDTHFDFDASAVYYTDADSLAELSAYDVIVHAGDWWDDNSAAYWSALREYVETDTGGVVTTGWMAYTLSYDLYSFQADADAVTPIAPGGYTNSDYYYDETYVTAAHEVTDGLTTLYSSYEYVESAIQIDADAQSLGTIYGSDHAIVVRDGNSAGVGNTVYLGALYTESNYTEYSFRSGDWDQLLEQAVNWAAGDGATGSVTEIADNAAGENSDTLSDSGTIDFSDVDLTDTHTVSAVLVSATDSENGAVAARGSFTPVISDVSTGDGVGEVTWTYQVNDGAIDDLAEDQSLTQVYTVTVTDENGATADQTITITIRGSNDAPTVTAAVDSGAVTEIDDNTAGENSDTLSDSGTIDFADVDLTDTHTVSAVLVSATNSEVVGPVAARGSFTPVINNVSTGDGVGQITWTYQVNDGAIDDLAVGQSLTQVYTVTVTDENGTSVDQTVTITINGTNDDPTITAADSGGSVTEIADNAAGENSATLSDSGTIDFADVDLADTHTVSAVLVSANDSINGSVAARGSFTPVINNASTGDGAGQVTWSYQVNDGALDDLAAGQSLTQVYTVTVTDENGATVAQTVTITVNGTNDAPVVSGAVALGSVDEDNSFTVTQAQLLGQAGDVDTADTLSAVNVVVSQGNAGVLNNGNGTWTVTPADDWNGAVELSYDVTDGIANTAATANLTVNPVNDAPEIAVSIQNQNLILNGSFETGSNPGASFTTLFAGSTAINDWTVTGNSIDYIGGFWSPGDGARSLDLSGSLAGGVSQSFATVAGAQYTVDFQLAGNTFAFGDQFRDLSVAVTGNPIQNFSFDVTGYNTGSMGWEETSFTFTATQTTSTLTFTSLENSAIGPALDDVRVVRDGLFVDEDASRTINGITVSDADVDEGTGLVAVSLSSNHGDITLANVVGLSSFSGNGSHSVTLQGSLVEVNQALVGMTYDPDQDYNGLDQLAVGVNDLGNTGAGGPLSDAETIDIIVDPVNDAPDAVDDSVGLDLSGATFFAGTGHFYQYVAGGYTWHQSIAAASAAGGHLATITSAGENDAIFALTGGDWAWLGANDAASEGNFVWTVGPEAGDPLSYTNWSTGQPDDSFGEDYLHMWGGGGWNDWVAHAPIGYVVEFDPGLATIITEDSGTTFATSALLANDTDIDTGDILSVISVAPISGTTQGSVSLSGSNVTYDPGAAYQYLAAGETATDSFKYTITDGNGGFDTATVTVTINGLNDAPDAIDDAVGLNLSGASFYGGTGHFYQFVTTPLDWSQASAAAAAAGGHLATITSVGEQAHIIGLTGTNRAWLGGSDAAVEGEWLWVEGAEAGSQFWQGLHASAGGVPVGGLYNAWDLFEPNDGGGNEDYLEIFVVGGPWNDFPGSIAGNYVVEYDPGLSSTIITEDNGATFAASTLLGNDTDVDTSDTLSVISVAPIAGTTQGSVSLSGGNVTYNPGAAFQYLAAGETATDSFNYTITDGNGGFDTATVTVTVNGLNDAPVAVDDAVGLNLSGASFFAGNGHFYQFVTTPLDWSQASAAAAAAGGHLATITSVGEQAHVIGLTGTNRAWLGGSDAAVEGEWRWVEGAEAGSQFWQGQSVGAGGFPVGGFYNAWDLNEPNDAGSNEDYLEIFVVGGPWNDFPGSIAGNYVVEYDPGLSSTIITEDNGATFAASTLLANDTDVEGDTLSVISVAPIVGTTQGSVSLSGGNVTYNPGAAFQYLAAGETATDSFNYTITDGNGGFDTATVTVTINGLNDAPVAVDDSAFVASGSSVTVSVLDNDTDLDGDALTVTGNGGASNGGVVVNANNTVTYTPNAGFAGADNFTYTVSDVNGSTDTATVSVIVGLANHQTVGTDVFLQGNYMELGIAAAGSLGSANAAPAGYHPQNGSQISYLVDTDGWISGGSGRPPRSGDFTLPGSPVDGFAVGYNDGSNHAFANDERSGRNDLGASTIDTSVGAELSATTTGTAGGDLAMTQVISLNASNTYYETTVTFTNVSGGTLNDVRFMRTFDPDQDRNGSPGTYNTLNDVLSNPGTDNDIAISQATGPFSGISVNLVAFDDDARGSNFGFDNYNPYVSQAWDSPFDRGGASVDEAITMTLNFGTLAAGESLTKSFFTSLNGRDAANDMPIGTSAGETIDGGFGDDIILGLGGNDTLIGAGGDDLFVFANGGGNDTVNDFTAGTATADVLDVSAFGYSDLASLLAVTNDVGTNTVIQLDANDSVTLIGVNEAQLQEDDFLFA